MLKLWDGMIGNHLYRDKMNNKILIGSIIALCILIGVSFTSVVGYRSVVSDVKASPLFNIRSRRAIQKDNKDLSCKYVGNGNGINLRIPDREEKKVLIRKVIDRLHFMDDGTFNKLVNSVIYRTKLNRDINENEVKKTLYQIRENPEILLNENNLNGNKSTWIHGEFCISAWLIGCAITEWILGLITLILLPIVIIIGVLFPSYICPEPTSLPVPPCV